MTTSSPHVQFWEEAISVLRTVYFHRGERKFVPPTVTNWISTLEGFICLWKKLKIEGFKFLLTRNANQDPLENFFGRVRLHGARNINPSCTSFKNSFKTLIINNFSSVHSPGANNKDDHCVSLFESTRCFLDNTSNHNFNGENSHIELAYDATQLPLITNRNEIATNTHAYITGYITRKILKQTSCKQCKEGLVSGSRRSYPLIEERAYCSKALLRPTTQLVTLFGHCADIMHQTLPTIAHQNSIKRTLSKRVEMLRNSLNFNCTVHDMFAVVIEKFVALYIYTWISNVNKILKGIDIRQINDPLKELAFKKMKKIRARRRGLDKAKQLV